MDNGNKQRDDKPNSGPIGPGTIVSKYTVIEKIGAGGMGEVFLADDSQLRRETALKFLPPNLLHNEELRVRFKREAMAAARLSHANIITVYDAGEFEGRPYIAMEYFPGRTLKELVRERPLSLAEVARAGLQIAEALDEAHRAGIVHRDVKSDNILINDAGTVKIFDFGLARLEEEAGLTQTGTALGTISYMSPEQVQGQPVDFRSDLFSLGVVLFELATGKLPFTGDNIAAIANSVATCAPVNPDSLNQDVNPILQQLIMKLLSKNPEDRYKSAGVVAAELGGMVSGRTQTQALAAVPRKKGLRSWFLGAAVAVIAVLSVMMFFREDDARPDRAERRILAVMPFENLGADEDDFFATGITDEITTHLTKLSGLGVISRSSTKHYHARGKTTREIGSELGASYVLEGNIHWDNASNPKRVRITTLLKEAKRDVTLWGETYDRLVDDIFAVQTDIARKVALAMDVALLDNEQHTLDVPPTANIEAYTFFLQGLDYFGQREWSLAEKMFTRATAMDTSFVPAWAMLSRTHSLLFWWYIDRTDERLALARQAAEQALRLEPSSAEAHIANGRYYYRGFLDYGKALEHYKQALEVQPSNSDLMFAIGSVYRRQGKWNDAIDQFREAIALDPRSLTKQRNLCETYFLTRDFGSALAVVDGMIALAPDDPSVRALRVRILALGYGNVTESIRVLESILPNNPSDEVVDALIGYFVLTGSPERAVSLSEQYRQSDYFQNDSSYYYLQLGEASRFVGATDQSVAAYDSARVILEKQVRERPDEAYYRSALGVAYAGLGRRAEAVEQGIRATELYSVKMDARAGTSWRLNLAIIYAMTGQNHQALEELRFLLSVPSEVTEVYLKLHPIFESVRQLPEFAELYTIGQE
jgi:serine/threonine-protein kinase